ncbi:hypothetical protein P879_06948 [Paragonimus westermani]|uniref:Protein kinase domain-containing protein n=1 Tax=Paragonimus westermani TaxID=34504 RepID=A0A8T0DR59_9TREM|nr:hypothetical protein P879_06948 [Paragonimus westermani]
MLWDENYITNAVDVPIQGTLPLPTPSVAVHHIVDFQHSVWSKVIDLELCDRSCLSSLMANINFIRKLLPAELKKDGKVVNFGTASQFVSLPTDIQLDQCSVILSYRLNPLGSAYDLLSCQQDGCRGLSEQTVAAIFSRALLCVEYLHSKDILHRDLCAKHLLLAEDESNAQNLRIILCGLGSVAYFPPSGVNVGRNDLPSIDYSWRGWNVNGFGSVYGHPIAWKGPEVVAQDFTGYSWPSDIYSLGLILAELFNGEPPYAGLHPTVIALKKMSGAEVPALSKPDSNDVPSQELLDIYSACTQPDPSKRPSATVLLQMPWVQWGLQQQFDRIRLEREKNGSSDSSVDDISTKFEKVL